MVQMLDHAEALLQHLLAHPALMFSSTAAAAASAAAAGRVHDPDAGRR
jgi:hypothetical protein